jgi:hypothetical protein
MALGSCKAGVWVRGRVTASPVPCIVELLLRNVNNLTACFLRRSQLPFSFPTDRTCIEAGLDTCWQPNRDAVRMAIIPNTLEVEELWASAPLIEEARKSPHLELTGELQSLPFDAAGQLEQEKLFPHSVRGRRGQR